jgi:uncharacterized radical SAM superfamily Fe-S cluster-containing enzyme
MRDKFNREINYLRISVTDRCNLRCKYCMPEEGVEDIGHNKILSFENIQRIVEASAKLGITKYRITGGEPLVRKDIIDLVRALSKIPGVKELVMTTNGILLPEKAEALKEAGLKRVNIIHGTYMEDVKSAGNLFQSMALKAAKLKETYLETVASFLKLDYLRVDKDSFTIYLDKIQGFNKVPPEINLRYLGCNNEAITFEFNIE